MGGKLSLENALEAVAKGVTESLSIQTIAERVRPLLSGKVANLEARIVALLHTDSWGFVDFEKQVYVPRQRFFHHAHFRIQPTRDEIRQGILYPGHRLLPFCSRDLFPPDCHLCLADGTELGLKKSTVKLDDITIYHSLFGWERMVQYFVTDEPSNADKLLDRQDGSAEISLSVLDVAGVYQRHGFAVGDMFRVTVQDWARGRFTLEYCPASELDAEFPSCRRWCDLLESALEQTFDDLGVLTDVYEQLAHAFFYGDRFLVGFPGVPIAGFLAQSQEVELHPMGTNTIIWRQGEEPEEEDVSFQDYLPQGPMTGDTDSLDSILRDMGVALSEMEVRAYMLDELHSGRESLDNVLNRCLGGREVEFYDDEQEDEFYRLVEELWADVNERYNPFADGRKGECRGRLLEILESQLNWLRRLDARNLSPDMLPQKEMLALGQISATLTKLLETLDLPHDEPMEDIAGDEITETLERIASSSQALMDAVDRTLGG
ncbi:MAG: hypothetical protein JXR37_25935 [Kiritimatiellae bacterium]|nr:hypothetical protein [Kiritimatiellia bacterium]